MLPGSLFCSRDFRLLLLGQGTSQLGSYVGAIALPLLAVVSLDASPADVGLITASATVAFALIGLPAGAWLDHWPRRPVLVGSDAVRALVLATVPLAALLGSLSVLHLVVASLLVGLARVFFDIGYRSYLPSVVGADRVLAGNSSMEFVRACGQVAGPGLGGALVAGIGAASVVLIQAVTFTISAISLLAVRTVEPAVAASPERQRLRSSIADGLTFVFRNHVLRATAIASATSNFAFAIASAVTFIFMSRTLALSPAAIGLVVAGGAGAVMLGAATTTALAHVVGSARIVWLSLAGTAPLALVGVFAQPGWRVVLIVVGTAAGEFGQIVYAITNVSLRQRLCPDRMLGRVTATMTFLIMALFPLGALLGGVLGEAIGTRATLLVAGGLLFVGPLVLYVALRDVRDVEAIGAWTS